MRESCSAWAALVVSPAKVFVLMAGDNAPDYPLVEVMHDLKPEQKITAIHIPAADTGAGSPWSILEDVIGDPAEIAYYIVKDGPSKALG
jgi:hypothetical protein